MAFLEELKYTFRGFGWEEALVPLILVVVYFIYASRLKRRTRALQSAHNRTVNSWGEHRPSAFTVELESGTVNGIPWRSGLGALEKLGKPESGDFSTSHLNYKASGLYLSLLEGRIDGWDFSVVPRDGSAACRLEMELENGRLVPLDANLGPEAVELHLGKPDWQEGQELSYRRHNWDFAFEFGEDDRLISVYLFPREEETGS